MFKNKKSIFDEISSIIKEVNSNDFLTNEDFNEIEKYRDKDNFINLTKVKDMNELKKIVDLVDKKNTLEAIQNGDIDINTAAENLAKKLSDIIGADTVNVSIKVPKGEKIVTITAEKPEIKENIYKVGYSEPKEEEKPKCTCEGCPKDCKGECSIVEGEKPLVTESGVVSTADEDVEDVFDLETEAGFEKMYAVREVGGKDNPMFLNAITHICETQHFPEALILPYNDYEDEDVIGYILVPNVWGKIYLSAADEYVNLINAGLEVYIINPQTFELTQITDALDLYKYAMTELEEEMNF